MKTQLPSTAVFSSSEIQIHYKRPLYDSMRYISSFVDAVDIIREFANPNQLDLKEFFWAIYLSNANRLLGICQISIGSTTKTVVGIKEIFQGALLLNASGIIVAHNHPSGKLEFSISDKEHSYRMAHLAPIMEVTLMDHIIITSEGCISLAATGFFDNL